MPDEDAYRLRYEAGTCVYCGADRPDGECGICSQRYEGREPITRAAFDASPSARSLRNPAHWHGVSCHACWDGDRLRRPDDLEVPDYWIPQTYPGGIGFARCTFHPNAWFRVDEMCSECVDEDEEQLE